MLSDAGVDEQDKPHACSSGTHVDVCNEVRCYFDNRNAESEDGVHVHIIAAVRRDLMREMLLGPDQSSISSLELKFCSTSSRLSPVRGK